MSVATKLKSSQEPVAEPRVILGQAGNRVRILGEFKRRNEGLKIPQRPKNAVSRCTQSIVQRNVSIDSSCSSDSSSSNSSVKMVSSRKTVKRNGVKPIEAKVAPTSNESVMDFSPAMSPPLKRCDWITLFSDPMYTSFHEKEWGVPVHDDGKLKLFNNFDPSSIAQLTEKKMMSLKDDGSLLLSETKLRATLENAKQILKVQQEFGSFSSYCWRFVNHKPLNNGFRYARQVPVKTSKAELMSKDMMWRGFRCVGPTVVYSFMQVAGMVNDHLVTCFRYQQCCNADVKKDIKKNHETEMINLSNEKDCSRRMKARCSEILAGPYLGRQMVL
ncbi:anthocyanidin 3-O-glucosyltransferase 5 [Hibiscus syriacus]|uniref:Anthocyanidin 3-O-glucosyltransferase 5 n=1 Tax=Hibiscus syriacus TaxID=106335 RepID=A0A6A2XT80_HIBSY|nr:anthocyanidin 3-O-glucosyltransferase 5 [Hibiscus syriacus]